VKSLALATGAYARIRRQFKVSIGKMEGIEEPLARIAGNAYVMDAAATLITAGIMLGEKPAVLSAIVKYHCTHRGQRAIIVIDGDATNEGLDVLAKRLEQQQRNRDPQLQVVANKAITLKGEPAQQLDTVISANQQTAWSSVVLAKADGKLLTLQITLPADNQQQAQTAAENVINTITLK